MRVQFFLVFFLTMLFFGFSQTVDEIPKDENTEEEIIEIRNKVNEPSKLKFRGNNVPEDVARELDNLQGHTAPNPILDSEFVPSAFTGRIYPSVSLEGYRDDLTKLVGLIATKNGDSYEIGIVSFLRPDAELEVLVPKDGILVERKLEKRNEHKIGWLLSIELD